MNDSILELDKHRISCEFNKCNLKEFEKFRDHAKQRLNSLTEYVDETRDHNKAIDMYLDKYMPVKI